jgi:hypothetical protein
LINYILMRNEEEIIISPYLGKLEGNLGPIRTF